MHKNNQKDEIDASKINNSTIQSQNDKEEINENIETSCKEKSAKEISNKANNAEKQSYQKSIVTTFGDVLNSSSDNCQTDTKTDNGIDLINETKHNTTPIETYITFIDIDAFDGPLFVLVGAWHPVYQLISLLLSSLNG